VTQSSQPSQFALQVPDDLAAGAYSNIVAVWHTPYEFTLDFAVSQPTQMVTDASGQTVLVVPARVVSRVKIPTATVFALMQALSTNEHEYEQEFGRIARPGQPGTDDPLYPPES
jgi:hypothetical protein